MNVFRAATSEPKLRGEFYTPDALVDRIFAVLDPTPGDVILDPACGDGAFLVGAVRHLAPKLKGTPSQCAERLLASITGWELHPEAAEAAKERVAAAIQQAAGVITPAEWVRVQVGSALQPGFDPRGELRCGANRLFVAGNPPYVEAKRLDAAERARLKAQYPDAASGAPDLYLYFLHAALDWLQGDDRLALVLPNKVLVNTNSRALRERLLRENSLRGIDFATMAKLFGEAAVYPVVLYAGAPNATASAPRLARLHAASGGLAVTALPDAPVKVYAATRSRALFPTPESPVAAGALMRLLDQTAYGRLDDVLDIRWTVSFHRRGLRERYVSAVKPDSPHARRFLGGLSFSGNGEVARYRVDWAGWWIDYDPAALAADGNSLPDVALFDGPKLALCQNGRTLRAAFDDQSFVFKDVFLCGLPRAVPHPLAQQPRALVGLLCSGVTQFFYAQVFHGGHVGSGYLHFLNSFLQDVPLGEWSAEAAERVASFVARLERDEPGMDRLALEQAIEGEVEAAFALAEGEREAIRAWLATDPGWQARDRIRRRTA